MMNIDDGLPAPLPPGSIAPPPPPRNLEPLDPKSSLVNRDDGVGLRSPVDEMGRRPHELDDDQEDDARENGNNVDDDDADRDALANERYGDPYANLEQAFGGSSAFSTNSASRTKDGDLIGF